MCKELEGGGRDRFKSAIINIRLERFGGKIKNHS